MNTVHAPAIANRSRREVVNAILCILVGVAFGYSLLVVGPREVADEGFHGPQIWEFFQKNYDLLRTTTMLPTYHLVLGLVDQAFGRYDLRLMRFTNLLGGMLLPFFMWRLVSVSSAADPAQRTVQWFYMPLLFPFFFLVYTDTWALVAVVATIYCAVNGRGVLAAIAGCAAMLLRQDLVIWVGLAWLLMLLQGWTWAGLRHDLPSRARASFMTALPMLLVLILFLLFLVWNGGIAVGDKARHELGFNVTNVFYFLLCAWAIFLPFNLEALSRILPLLRRPLCLALVAVGFVVYMATYANRHPFNHPSLDFYLHNKGLYLLTTYWWFRAAAYIPMAWMVLAVAVTPLPQPRFKLLYLIAPLSAGLHPLIEQRYYLAALTLFHAWRPGLDKKWEIATLAMYVLASGVIVIGIAFDYFFP